MICRFKVVSRRSWTVAWGWTAPPSSATEAVCPTLKPPSGKCYGSVPWPLFSSPTLPSVTPGTPGHQGQSLSPASFHGSGRVPHCAFMSFSAALETLLLRKELGWSSICGLCTMMRKNGKTQSALTQVRGIITVKPFYKISVSPVFSNTSSATTKLKAIEDFSLEICLQLY